MTQVSPVHPTIDLHIGVKSDPIIYRYSYEWLFDLMAEEEIYHLQLGTFFELFSLPDGYFLRLKESAAQRGIVISSVFSAYRELGGFFSEDPDLRQVTIRNYRRLIEVAAVLGAASAGTSAGAVLRDRLSYREQGIRAYIEGMKDLLHYARDCGLSCLTSEPMSCYAEPPVSSREIRSLGEELVSYHRAHSSTTASYGYCSDVSHGWADRHEQIVEDNLTLFQASFPYLYEFHFKNTDKIYHKTFGFEPENLSHGIIDVRWIRKLLIEHRHVLPQETIVGYLEHPGPKLGRDYSDITLERSLRESLRHLKREFIG
ncbi:MAG TPA: TIM barrel protein [Atribacteraceae bacterium]|nr:TIM barrel protein [Atribacteraceae bacterium]